MPHGRAHHVISSRDQRACRIQDSLLTDSRPATNKMMSGGARSPVNGIDKQKVALIHASETAKAEARDESVRRNGQVLNPACFVLF